MKYMIVQDNLDINFENRINSAINNGWTLQGGVSVYKGWYYQAIVKEN